MEGSWKFNPFYWMALDRVDRANQGQKSLSLNPLKWSGRTIRVFFVALFVLLTPIYFFSGIQPASSIEEAEAANYPSLNIPSLDLETPVVPLELTDHQLIAPATLAGSYSQSENKTFIIGHSSTVFSKLDQVELYQHFNYNNAEYTITKIETLAKADISMSEILAPAEQPTIIIMTCAGAPLPNQDATHRLIITAELSHQASHGYINSAAATSTNTDALTNFTVTPDVE